MLNFLKKSSNPKVWLITSEHKCDNVQPLELAKNITDEKSITTLDKLHGHTEIKGFPDLAIGIGYGCTETLEGIKERSKGKTKIAIILDPLKDHDIFDFIILPSYEPYHVDEDSVIKTTGLINYVNQNFLEETEKLFRKDKKYEDIRSSVNLIAPYLTVLIGGHHTGGNVSEQDAVKIAEFVNEWVQKNKGTALITTSPRTEIETTKKLKELITANNYFYDYKERDTENPYDVFLTLANEILVTGDSARMVSEACSSNKKTYIYKPEEIGFQYEPLIDQLVENKHAYSFDDLTGEKDFIKLDEAKRVGERIREKL